MKKLIFVLVIAAIFFSCNTGTKTTHFTINGTVEGLDEGMVYLQNRVEGDWIKLDSAEFTGGVFQLEGEINLPEAWYISFKDQNKFLAIFVEPGEIKVSGDIENWRDAKITGSASHDALEAYYDSREDLDQRLSEAYNLYREAKKANDTLSLESLEKKMDMLDDEERNFIISSTLDNAGNILGPYLAYRNSYYLQLEELQDLTGRINPELEESTYVKWLNDRINILENVAIGQPAPDFIMNDTLGNPVSLSSLKGKYLLVDFWASWCGPCRAENPNVVDNYLKYKNAGFDVLGVSFDTNRDKWIQAVEDDHLAWTQLSDLEGWGNAAGKIYGIKSIPSNVLLDPDGIIIARNLRGDELGGKLKEIFSN